MLNQAVILLLIISFVDIALGLFAILKNPKERVNISFALFSLALLIWINASFFEDELAVPTQRYLLMKLDFASGIFASFLLFLFCLNVSKSVIASKKYVSISLLAIPAFFSLLIFFTRLIISGYEISYGTINPYFGNAYILYGALIGAALFSGLVALAWRFGKSTPEDRVKFVYLFIGFSLSSIIAFVTNIALTDYIRNTPDYSLYSRFGAFGTIFLTVSSGYAIVKHRLLNIKIITTELLSLGILVFSLFQVLKSRDVSDLFVNGIVFLVLLAFIIMLVRSVENEVRRKDELQVISDQLADANFRLKELDQARAEFMSFASHQLQTPLTAIRGFASLLLDGSGGALTESEKDMIGKISVSSERMVHLVEDYLNLSRIESGKLQFEFSKWRLEDICQEVVDTLAIKAEEKDLSLIFHKPDDFLPEIIIDGAKVREVISNLVDNAVKYTPSGVVTVDIAQRRHTANETTDWIRITVSDSGLGISKDELPHLFAKFGRGTNEERLKIKGTGLGLFVGKVMIENNGGKIWAESDGEGKGSCFIVELPIEQSEAAKSGSGGSSCNRCIANPMLSA